MLRICVMIRTFSTDYKRCCFHCYCTVLLEVSLLATVIKITSHYNIKLPLILKDIHEVLGYCCLFRPTFLKPQVIVSRGGGAIWDYRGQGTVFLRRGAFYKRQCPSVCPSVIWNITLFVWENLATLLLFLSDIFLLVSLDVIFLATLPAAPLTPAFISVTRENNAGLGPVL